MATNIQTSISTRNHPGRLYPIIAQRPPSRLRLPRKPGDLNRIRPVGDLGEVVLHLQPQPGFRAAAEGLGQTNRHFRRHAGVAVEQLGQRLARHAKPFGRFRHRQVEGDKALFPYDLAGMRRVEHHGHGFLRLWA